MKASDLLLRHDCVELHHGVATAGQSHIGCGNVEDRGCLKGLWPNQLAYYTLVYTAPYSEAGSRQLDRIAVLEKITADAPASGTNLWHKLVYQFLQVWLMSMLA